MTKINETLRFRGITSMTNEMLTCILQQTYSRRVLAMAAKLQNYRPFSNETYGELLPNFIRRIATICNVNSSAFVVDLGCGTGNVLSQLRMAYGCRTYGIEVQDECIKAANSMISEAGHRINLWGAPVVVDSIMIEHGNMLDNPNLRQLLSDVDLVVVNNLMFEATCESSYLGTIKELISP